MKLRYAVIRLLFYDLGHLDILLVKLFGALSWDSFQFWGCGELNYGGYICSFILFGYLVMLR